MLLSADYMHDSLYQNVSILNLDCWSYLKM